MRELRLAFLVLVLVLPVAAQMGTTYQIRDLGIRPGFSSSVAESSNWLGSVTGSQLTEPSGTPPVRTSCHAFLWNALTGMRDLGTLGTACAAGRRVDALGRVGGSLLLPLAPSGFGYRAFFWSPAGGMIDIGSLANRPADATMLAGMNSRGDIAGFSQEGQYSLGNPPYERAFYWSRSTGIQDLGSLAGVGVGKSRAMAINDSGKIAGMSSEGIGAWSGPYAVYWPSWSSPIVNLAGRFGIPGSSQALLINNRDQMAGVRWGDDRRMIGIFIADPVAGPVVEIGNLGVCCGAGLTNPAVTGMNDSGQVAGTANLGSDPAALMKRAFRWTPPGAGAAVWADISPLPGDSETVATSINIWGQVVGASYTSGGPRHAILWTPASGTVALPPLQPGGQCNPADISILGIIAGSCQDASGLQHAVVWMPRPGR